MSTGLFPLLLLDLSDISLDFDLSKKTDQLVDGRWCLWVAMLHASLRSLGMMSSRLSQHVTRSIMHLLEGAKHEMAMSSESAAAVPVRHTHRWMCPTKSALTNVASTVIKKCMTEQELQLQIEQFLNRHGITPTTFGLWAMNDSRFVFDLRNGRMCYGKTVRRVLSFMVEYDRKQEAKRLRIMTQA
jgi:hypothetical protein